MTLHSPLASPGATRDALRRWGLHTRKSLGQHFLIDDRIIGKILDVADVHAGETIIEVGPGIGTLTLALLQQHANIIAVEKDERLLPVLDSIGSDKLAIINADALEVRERDFPSGFAKPTKLVSNLPYEVAATIALDYLQRFSSIESATVMVQREVADRIGAKPGGKDYGAYTVKLNLLARPGSAFNVSRNCFMPPPHVDSTVIRLDRVTSLATALSRELYEASAQMANAAFFQRRKTVRNSMRAYYDANGMDTSVVDMVLRETGINPKSRGEVLGQDDFKALGAALCALR
ncbi:MAG: 16S rRNA (adenine(1518)-N(6)/adenine(1519)-N(6))-dimethyltransferase RsmA [Coriobacteriales bacterium]|jgi:16S rRNA (adenine1518-N6/adenine1519-N6)-dimethyltransferase|nr:16S rRNA (adenine(1518)-N(6)/adenine(1519)-N(6))-dimethyltransferase RsmA [Coriobacteriales bacterium]